MANIETDKVTIPVNSPEAGVLVKQFAETGETIQVGSNLFTIDPDQKPTKSSSLPEKKTSSVKEEEEEKEKKKSLGETAKSSTFSSLFVEKKPSASSNIPSYSNVSPSKTGFTSPTSTPTLSSPTSTSTSTSSSPTPTLSASRGEKKEPMTRMRQRIAERMKQSQNTAASLTTFNEIDLSTLLATRSRLQEDFKAKHGTKLGLMGPFVKAATMALQEIPIINARLDNTTNSITYHDYVDISVAVATPKGLVTPVLRSCQDKGIAEIELELAALGERARHNQISIEELAGGTFTISNGGVFGSMMGTPIINVPQSAILGMHAIKERPVVIMGEEGKKTIEPRPMMYVALTYDHRLIDGREAVTFLVRLGQLLEDPLRFLFNL